MMNLSATTDKLSLITSTTDDCDVHVSYVDVTTATGVQTPGRKNTQPTTATTTDITGSPASGDVRNVKMIQIRVINGTTNDVTVQFDQNGTLITMLKCTLLVNEELVCREGVWFHYDSNGGIYGVGQTLATQADMETGTSTTLVVPVGRQHFHPGHPKAWVSCGVAADIQQSYNVASLTDNGTGDVTVTFTTGFAAATYCATVSVEMTATTYAVANARSPHIRSGGRATGSCRFDCIDGTVTTQLIKDPTTWHIVFWGDFA